MPAKRRTKASKRTSRPSSPRKPSQPSEQALRDYVRANAEYYLKDPNISSIGVGHKITGGKRSKTVSIQFTVRKKVAGLQIESIDSKPIPKTVVINGRPVPTDVIERDFETCYRLVALEEKSDRKQRRDPVVPGISVSHPCGTAGTIGLIVFDAQDSTPYILSNWHVLQTPKGALGDPIVQPGPADDNRIGENRAGTLVRSHLGVACDAAIAKIEGRGLEAAILDLGVAPTKVGHVQLGDRVVKSGRTTDVTYGIVTRVDVVSKISYREAGEHPIGGFEIGVDPKRPPSNGEISMGGDSGSAWLIAGKKRGATDVLVGLHFAGESANTEQEHALACYAHAVLEKLEVVLTPPSGAKATTEALAVGYDPAFLGPKVPLPALSDALRKDAVVLKGSTTIDYTHFSLALSKKRKMARFVAWNVDGTRLRKDGRKGLTFKLDMRIAEKWQTGESVYSDNKLDRGHIARRADLVWGSAGEAKQGNVDSFFFTNITPQHQAFNQSMRHGLWGRLEDALYEDVDVDRLRLTVLGGPIFKDKDLTYRGARVPSDFWKIAVFIDAADQKLKAKAYVLTQDNLLDDIEAFELDEFRIYQVSVADLEQRTGLRFGSVKDCDDFKVGRVTESLSADGRRRPVREVTGRADLIA